MEVGILANAKEMRIVTLAQMAREHFVLLIEVRAKRIIISRYSKLGDMANEGPNSLIQADMCRAGEYRSKETGVTALACIADKPPLHDVHTA